MKITMLGHATLLIEMDGQRILTDPWLTDPLYFGQLSHPGGFKSFSEAPPVDLLLVSHGHDDHFDAATLKMIPPKTPVFIFKGYAKKARRLGCENVHPMTPGDSRAAGSVKISAMTGKHPGGIATFMLEGREGKVYFGGDSVYTPLLEDALRGTEPDVCLMPISGGSAGPMKFHMNAREAAALAKAAAAKLVIPIHYHFALKIPSLNRFLFRVDCLREFRDAMTEIAPGVPVAVLDYNETWEK